MLAAYAARINDDDPLSALEVGDIDAPEAARGLGHGSTVKAAALNHHDLWSLRGVGLAEDKLPMILGCDAAGIDGRRHRGRRARGHRRPGSRRRRRDARPEAVAAVGGLPRDAGRAGRRTGRQRRRRSRPSCPGKRPARVSTAWLTAYRMLFTKAQVSRRPDRPGPGRRWRRRHRGDRAGQGGRSAGSSRPSRSEAKRARADELGADEVFEPGARLPDRVDAVIETVGDATFGHSLKSMRPGGRVVVCRLDEWWRDRRSSCSGCSSFSSRCSARRWAPRASSSRC